MRVPGMFRVDCGCRHFSSSTEESYRYRTGNSSTFTTTAPQTARGARFDQLDTSANTRNGLPLPF